LHSFFGHLSPKGWVYYAQAMDAFYRAGRDSDRLRASGELAEEATPPPPLAPAQEANFLGFHDGTTGVAISGWVYDTRRPDSPTDVEIYDGERLLATVQANLFRPDLLRGGKGNGRHGFRYATPKSLRDGQAHHIRVKIAGSDFELTGTPQTLLCPAPPS